MAVTRRGRAAGAARIRRYSVVRWAAESAAICQRRVLSAAAAAALQSGSVPSGLTALCERRAAAGVRSGPAGRQTADAPLSGRRHRWTPPAAAPAARRHHMAAEYSVIQRRTERSMASYRARHNAERHATSQHRADIVHDRTTTTQNDGKPQNGTYTYTGKPWQLKVLR